MSSGDAKFYQLAFDTCVEFGRSDVEVFLEGFKEFDKRNVGAMNAAELLQCLRAMGESLITPEEVKQIIKEFDTDNSGVIEWNEFLEVSSTQAIIVIGIGTIP